MPSPEETLIQAVIQQSVIDLEAWVGRRRIRSSRQFSEHTAELWESAVYAYHWLHGMPVGSQNRLSFQDACQLLDCTDHAVIRDRIIGKFDAAQMDYIRGRQARQLLMQHSEYAPKMMREWGVKVRKLCMLALYGEGRDESVQPTWESPAAAEGKDSAEEEFALVG